MNVAKIYRWETSRQYKRLFNYQFWVATHHLNNTFLKYMNMILSDFFEGDEVHRLYYLKDELIMILYIIMFTISMYIM